MTGTDWLRTFDTVSGPDALDELQCCLDDLWSAHSEISEDVRLHVSVAAYEIGTNIIEHAGGGRPVLMRVELRLLPERIEITFTDDGRRPLLDLESVGLPDDLADRGRGLAIAKGLIDGLSYHRRGGKNHWKLVHRRES